MNVACPSCNATYSIEDDRIPPGGVNLKCPRCQAVFGVRPAAATAGVPLPPPSAAPPIGAGVPLPPPIPPAAAGVPLPPPPQASPPPAGGAVPLPAASAPPPGPPPGARAGAMPPGIAPPPGPPPGARGGAMGIAPPPGPPPGAVPLPAATAAPGYGPPPGAVPPPPPFAEPGADATVRIPPPPPPSPGTGLDFGSFDLGAEELAPPPPPAQPPSDVQAEPIDFGELGIDVPPPPPLVEDGGLEFDPTAGAPAPPTTDPDLREFLAHTAGPSAGERWHVRRASGKVFGPFTRETIQQMLGNGQLAGNEELSPDGSAWRSLADEGFEPAARQPPRIGAPPAIAPRVDADDATGNARARLPRIALSRRNAAIAAGLAFLVAGAILELATPYGFYFRNLLLDYAAPEAGSPLARALAEARQGIARGTFTGYRAAAEAAERGLAQDPEDVHARALFARAVHGLAERFVATPSALSRAESLLAAIAATAPDDPEVRKARAAAALSKGAAAEVAGHLAPLGGDPEALELLARAQLALRQDAEAKATIDRLLAAPKPSAEVLHLAGLQASRAGDRSGATARFQAALATDPQHATSAVELGALALDARDAKRALEHLVPASTSPSLGGAALARARSLLGEAHARSNDPAAAERELSAAVELAPAEAEPRLRLARFLLERRRAAPAVEVLERLKDRAHGDPAIATTLVKAYVAANQPLQAESLVQALRAKRPDDARLAWLQGLVHAANGKDAEAVEAYREALAADGQLLAARISLARALARRGEADAALAELEAAPAEDEDPELHAARGEALLAKGDRAGAKAAFDAALALEPSLLAAHLGRATLLEEEGDLEAARAAYAEAVKLNDAAAENHLRLGAVLHRLGRNDEAVAALEKARTLEPENAAILSRLAAARFDAGKLDEAIATAEAARALDATRAEPHLQLSRFLLAKGDVGGAVQAAREAVERDGGRAEAHYQLGLAYQRSASPMDALEAFQAAAKLDPASADVHERQAEVFTSVGSLGRAAAAYEQALRLDPSRRKLLLAVADCHLRSNRWDKALEALRRADGLDGVAFRMGLAYQEKGDAKNAIAQFRRATREPEPEPLAWRQLGYAYKERNRIRDAVASFRRYLEARPAADDKAEIEDEIATLRF